MRAGNRPLQFDYCLETILQIHPISSVYLVWIQAICLFRETIGQFDFAGDDKYNR